MAQGETGRLLELIDEAYSGHAWHGPSLRSALRGVTARQAAWRPAPGRHNIWEVAVHAAYWKYVVRRRLLRESNRGFPEPGSNWFERPPSEASSGTRARFRADTKAWQRDLALLARIHQELRATVSGFRPADLERRVGGSRYTCWRTIAGVAFHDVYHAGQIQLLKRLAQRL